MKIAFVTNFCTHYVIRLFELLAAKHDITFYFIGGHETYWEKKNRSWLGNFKGRYLKGFFVLPGFKITPRLLGLFFEKYDIFIKTIDDKFSLPLIFLIAKLKKKPFILWTGLWQHPQTWIHKMTFRLTMFIYRHSSAIVVYGEHVKQYLLNLGIESEKIFIASHAVDNAVFNKSFSDSQKVNLRKNLNFQNGRILLYVGRLETCKGLDYLIEAVSCLKSNLVHLLFIGEGSEKPRLEKKCQRASLSFKFLNHVSNEALYRYYAAADIFVLPSITTKDFKEPWGLVVNEAMNQSCPIIATAAVGAAGGGLIEHGKTGFIIPERNSSALKKAIEILLNDQNIFLAMREASRERIQDWTPEKMSEGFIQAINYVAKV